MRAAAGVMAGIAGNAAANGVIVQDSATVPIGTGGGGAGCPVCPGGRAVGADGCDRLFGHRPAPGNQGGVRTPLNPVPGAKGVPDDSIRPRHAPRRRKTDAGGVAQGEGAIPARRPPGARLEPSVAPRPPHGGKRVGRGKKLRFPTGKLGTSIKKLDPPTGKLELSIKKLDFPT
jgi:hypothetical protein